MKLIFVYNAKADRLNKMLDFAHKIVSPSTYACDLCALTHGNFGEREEWKRFREETDVDMQFLYIEDFEKKFNTKGTYPAIYILDNSNLTPFLNREEIAKFQEVDELISTIKTKLTAN